MSENNENKEKNSFMEVINNFAERIAGPLSTFASYPTVAAVQDGLVGVMALIIIGSVFLILGTFSVPAIGASGEPILGFLAPYSDTFFLFNNLTMNFIAIYISITIAMSYGQKKGISNINGAVIGLATFLLISTDALVDGTIDVSNFSAQGMLVAIATSLLSIQLYSFLIKKNITINLPDSVPPNVGNAFTSLLPLFIVLAVAWFIRQIIGFDLVEWLNTFLAPIINAADNVVAYTLGNALNGLLWSVGLHGDNIIGGVVTPFVTQWQTTNANLFMEGTAAVDLPHIWTGGLNRLVMWPATVWPLLILLFTSKVKHHRPLAIAALPAGIFTIIEPIMFGLPVVLNPFLMIPFIISITVTSLVSYLAFEFQLINRFYASLPWATPPFLLGPLGTGDWRTLILIALNVVIGLVIFYPFFKAFEKSELEKERQRISEDMSVPEPSAEL